MEIIQIIGITLPKKDNLSSELWSVVTNKEHQEKHGLVFFDHADGFAGNPKNYTCALGIELSRVRSETKSLDCLENVKYNISLEDIFRLKNKVLMGLGYLKSLGVYYTDIPIKLITFVKML